MSEMTLPSRHRIRNSKPGGLRPSTLPLGHRGSPQCRVLGVDGEETFCFFQTAETGKRTLNSSGKGSGVNHHPRAPAPAVSKQPPVKVNDSSITNNITIKDNGVPQQTHQKTQQVQQQSSQPHQGQQPIPQISQQEKNASQQQCQQQQQHINTIHFRSEPAKRLNRHPQRQPLRGRGRGHGSTNLRGLGRLNYPQ